MDQNRVSQLKKRAAREDDELDPAAPQVRTTPIISASEKVLFGQLQHFRRNCVLYAVVSAFPDTIKPPHARNEISSQSRRSAFQALLGLD
jgi:hypothetical protein